MRRRVVVTGLGVVSPLGDDVETFWRALRDGRSGITALGGDLAALPAAIGGVVASPPAADAAAEAPGVRYALTAAVAAAAGARLDEGTLDRRRIGVALGANFRGPDVHALCRLAGRLPAGGAPDAVARLEPAPGDERVLTGVLAHLAACRVALRLDARGPFASPVGACAAGTLAVLSAARAVAEGRADVMVAGGSGANLDPITIAGYQALGILASGTRPPAESSRPFDRGADGQVLSDGAAVLVLEEHGHALRRGVRPLAELAGFGCSTEARPLAAPDPGGAGAVRAMRRALDDAGLGPADVDWVCANAVSRPEVDAAELAALVTVFGHAHPGVAVSAVKSMLGNAVAASGPLQLAAAVLALHAQVVPPTLNLDEPEPASPLDLTPGRAVARRLRTVLSNTFAFGGQNAVVVVREAPPHGSVRR